MKNRISLKEKLRYIVRKNMREFHGIMSKFFLKSITLENYHGISGYYEIDKKNMAFSNPAILSAIQVLLSTYFKAFLPIFLINILLVKESGHPGRKGNGFFM